jgi:lipopolysaccharide biosynthesis protein
MAPPTDSVLAIPLGPTFPGPRLDHPVGVILHVFYPDLADELRTYLENIPGAVDVYISTDTPTKRDVIERAFSGWSKGRLDVRLAVNRGRDVAPKLITFKDVYARHPIVLHLHSKKSPHDSCLRMWRHFTYENLIGDPSIAGGILSMMEHCPDIGMVAPDHYFGVKNLIGWAGNLDIAQPLAARMGVDIDPAAPLDFPSGSMFWARSAALRPLLDLDLSFEDFAPERGQPDGTLAHAIERLFFYSCQISGLKWIKVCRPELSHEREHALANIGDVSELKAYLKASARPLGLHRDPGRARFQSQA